MTFAEPHGLQFSSDLSKFFAVHALAFRGMTRENELLASQDPDLAAKDSAINETRWPHVDKTRADRLKSSPPQTMTSKNLKDISKNSGK